MSDIVFSKIKSANWTALFYLFFVVFFVKTVDWKSAFDKRQTMLLRTFSNGEWKSPRDGIVYFDDYQQGQPRDADGFAGMAVCYEKLGDDRKALRYFLQAIKLAPKEELYQRRLQAVRDRLQETSATNFFKSLISK